MKRALFLAIALGFMGGCATGPGLPPKAGPEEVDLYDPNLGQSPPAGYRTIGPVRVETPLGTSQADIKMQLRAAAARLGADAVIFQRIRSSAEGQVSPDPSRPEQLIGEGVAIYWPQPETG